MAKKETDCVDKPAQCAYEDCKGGRIWYHAWYQRKGRDIPCEGESGVSGSLWIRRFMCCDCGRTFSRRPSFLAFGHRFLAAAYQQFLDAQAGRTGDWWQPGTAAVKAVIDRLRRTAASLTERLEICLGRPPSGRANLPEVLLLAKEVARQQTTSEHPRSSCHVLFLAIARTRSRALYSLTAT